MYGLQVIGFMVVWVYGCMGVWVCGCMGMGVWLYGYMGVWLYGYMGGGCMGIWVCGCMGIWGCVVVIAQNANNYTHLITSHVDWSACGMGQPFCSH